MRYFKGLCWGWVAIALVAAPAIALPERCWLSLEEYTPNRQIRTRMERGARRDFPEFFAQGWKPSDHTIYRGWTLMHLYRPLGRGDRSLEFRTLVFRPGSNQGIYMQDYPSVENLVSAGVPLEVAECLITGLDAGGI